MRFRRQTTVCPEGWYYLAILAVVFGGAVFKDVNLLLILAGMLLGPVLLNWQLVRATLRGLRLERKLPPSIGAGDVLSVALTLTNARRRLASWAVVAEEEIRRESDAAPNGHHPQSPLRPHVLFPHVQAGQASKGSYRGKLSRRGRYRIGPAKLSTRFPFGLLSRTLTIEDSQTLTVLPRLGRLTDGWTARRLDAFAGTDRRRRQPGPEGDFYGVREWRPGDGHRLIHWRSSARLGKLVVRQLERPRSRDVAVVLDLWQPEQATAEQLRNVEHVVSFAATVLTDACRKGGSNVYLGLSNTETECVGGATSPAILQGLMERLALVEARSDDALPSLLARTLRRVVAETEIVLVSTRPTDLTDPSRFAALHAQPGFPERLRRIRRIDASSEQLEQYFQVELP